MKNKIYRFSINDKAVPSGGWSIFTRVLLALIGLAGLVLAFMFSIVLLAIAAVLALVLILYFWWKTRHLRKRFRETTDEGRVFDGESRRDDL